eukprot:Gb_40981 [translate_table: standard]
MYSTRCWRRHLMFGTSFLKEAISMFVGMQKAWPGMFIGHYILLSKSKNLSTVQKQKLQLRNSRLKEGTCEMYGDSSCHVWSTSISSQFKFSRF